jgi:hypothetical protein
MSTVTDENEVLGREPTAEEEELVAWAEEAVRKGLHSVNEALGRMVTLLTALLAGSAALLVQVPMPKGCKGAAVALLLIALASALWGSLPREALLAVNCPDDVRAERERGAAFKMRCLRVASVALVLAFGFAFLGLLLG